MNEVLLPEPGRQRPTLRRMITAGVDLAAEPARTALATVRWSSGRASVLSLSLGVDDAHIAEAALSAAKLGLDCPLGWPDDFLRFQQAHQAGRAVAPQEDRGVSRAEHLAIPSLQAAFRNQRWNPRRPRSVPLPHCGVAAGRYIAEHNDQRATLVALARRAGAPAGPVLPLCGYARLE